MHREEEYIIAIEQARLIEQEAYQEQLRVQQRQREALECEAMQYEHTLQQRYRQQQRQQQQLQWTTLCNRCSKSLVFIIDHHKHASSSSTQHTLRNEAYQSHLRLFRILHHRFQTVFHIHVLSKDYPVAPIEKASIQQAFVHQYHKHQIRFPYTSQDALECLWKTYCNKKHDYQHVLCFYNTVCFTNVFLRYFDDDTRSFDTQHAIVPFIHTELRTTRPYIRTQKGKVLLCDQFIYVPFALASLLPTCPMHNTPPVPFHTMIKTYHHSDTEQDYNPLYWLVDRHRTKVWRFAGFGHHRVKGGVYPVQF